MSHYQELYSIVDRAIEEDVGVGDVTSQVCIPQDATLFTKLVLKESGTIAGLPLLAYAFKKTHPDIEFIPFVDEGSSHHAGTVLGTIAGSALGIMAAERTVLNIIQHCSGIATRTKQYVKNVAHFNCKILDTRRTLPGLRPLEQYAIQVGGGTPHRKGLGDRFLIKQHHLVFVSKTSSSPIKEAVQRARKAKPDLLVEVEISTLATLKEALAAGVDLVALDRMPPETVRACVLAARETSTKIYVECTGMITPETIHDYAETGVDGIIIPSLAMAPSLEIRLLKSK